MERGFFDGAPGLIGLRFAEVWEAISAVVLAIGQHQFIRQFVEGFAGEAEVVGFDAVIFDAGGDGDGAGGGGAGTAEAVAGPGTVVGAFRGEERVADGAAIVGPAGVGAVEVVVEAAIDVVVVMIFVFGIEMGLFFGGRGTGFVGAGLFLGVLELIEDVGNPTVFVVGAEPEGVDAIGPVLDAEHAGAVFIRHIALKGSFPAVAPPVEAANESAEVVADSIQLVAERAGTRCVPPGDDAEKVVERHRHYGLRRDRIGTAP